MNAIVIDIKNGKFIKAFDTEKAKDGKDYDRNFLAENDFQVIANIEEMQAAFKTKELLRIYNKHAERRVKKFADSKTAARRTFELLLTIEPTKVQSKTKVGKLLELMADGELHTIEEILSVTKFDKPNLMTMISILKNPKKTKETVNIVRVGGKYKCEEK